MRRRQALERYKAGPEASCRRDAGPNEREIRQMEQDDRQKEQDRRQKEQDKRQKQQDERAMGIDGREDLCQEREEKLEGAEAKLNDEKEAVQAKEKALVDKEAQLSQRDADLQASVKEVLAPALQQVYGIVAKVCGFSGSGLDLTCLQLELVHMAANQSPNKGAKATHRKQSKSACATKLQKEDKPCRPCPASTHQMVRRSQAAKGANVE